MIFIPLLIFLVLIVILFFGFLIIRKIIKAKERLEKERIRQEAARPKPSDTASSPQVHYHVNSENFYAGDVGVVASDDAVVNRPNISTGPQRRCPYCGAEIGGNNRFCTKCGKQL